MKRILVVAGVLAALTLGCGKEAAKPSAPPAPVFPVYPGARYLTELTDVFRKAGALNGGTVPPQVLYDTDAPLEKVAAFYAKENGFSIAPSDGAGPDGKRPMAYYRTGDLGADARAIEPITKKLNLKVDVSKAVGSYRGVHISQTAVRPRVTLSRPYFDPTRSEVVDRTLIIMVRE